MVLATVTMKVAAFWNVTPCCLAEFYRISDSLAMCFTRLGVGCWRHHNLLIRQYISARIQTITYQIYSRRFQYFDFKTALTESDFQGWSCGFYMFTVLVLALLNLVMILKYIKHLHSCGSTCNTVK
jgi:hypothetical protein